jgi:hypothetical protein
MRSAHNLGRVGVKKRPAPIYLVTADDHVDPMLAVEFDRRDVYGHGHARFARGEHIMHLNERQNFL